MEHAKTIAEVAQMLNLSYQTVYSHRIRWGFFQMEGSRVWRVELSELEKRRKKSNNFSWLAPVSLENKKCQSKKEVRYGGLILQPQIVKELEDLLAQK